VGAAAEELLGVAVAGAEGTLAVVAATAIWAPAMAAGLSVAPTATVSTAGAGTGESIIARSDWTLLETGVAVAVVIDAESVDAAEKRVGP